MLPEKIYSLPAKAIALYSLVADWCVKHNTDGELEKKYLAVMYDPLGKKFRYRRYAQVLLDAGMWTDTGESYKFAQLNRNQKCTFESQIEDTVPNSEDELLKVKDAQLADLERFCAEFEPGERSQRNASLIGHYSNTQIQPLIKPNPKKRPGPKPQLSDVPGVELFVERIRGVGWKGKRIRARRIFDGLKGVSEMEIDLAISKMLSLKHVIPNPEYAAAIVVSIRNKAAASAQKAVEQKSKAAEGGVLTSKEPRPELVAYINEHPMHPDADELHRQYKAQEISLDAYLKKSAELAPVKKAC